MQLKIYASRNVARTSPWCPSITGTIHGGAVILPKRSTMKNDRRESVHPGETPPSPSPHGSRGECGFLFPRRAESMPRARGLIRGGRFSRWLHGHCSRLSIGCKRERERKEARERERDPFVLSSTLRAAESRLAGIADWTTQPRRDAANYPPPSPPLSPPPDTYPGRNREREGGIPRGNRLHTRYESLLNAARNRALVVCHFILLITVSSLFPLKRDGSTTEDRLLILRVASTRRGKIYGVVSANDEIFQATFFIIKVKKLFQASNGASINPLVDTRISIFS